MLESFKANERKKERGGTVSRLTATKDTVDNQRHC